MNPYQVLRVSPRADNQEIRRAYRKLALKFHPDKPDGDEQKFKEIVEAYGMLNEMDVTAGIEAYSFSGIDPFKVFQELFRDLDTGVTLADNAPNDAMNRNSGAAEMPFILHITPREILAGATKIIALRCQRFCKLCHGKGVADNSIDISCFQCRGSGVQAVVDIKANWHALATGDVKKTIDCGICHGEGILIPLSMQKCPTCQGERLVTKTKFISVTVAPGAAEDSLIVCPNEGNDSRRAHSRRSDLCLRLQCKFPPGWRRFKQHLIYQRQVTLHDCISTRDFQFSLTLLTGQEVTVEIEDVIKPMILQAGQSASVFVLDGAGLPFTDNSTGNLFLLLEIVFPSNRSSFGGGEEGQVVEKNTMRARAATTAEIEILANVISQNDDL
jgi:DnaJ-class molecular chaperone